MARILGKEDKSVNSIVEEPDQQRRFDNLLSRKCFRFKTLRGKVHSADSEAISADPSRMKDYSACEKVAKELLAQARLDTIFTDAILLECYCKVYC